jgi:hypothetical protein
MRRAFEIFILAVAQFQIAAALPNVVFILVDDLVYGDLGCCGIRG